MAFAPFDLTGKVALITGGNSGIGLGMAEGIAQAGGDVCIWGTNREKNEAAVERLAGYRTRVSAHVCDVADGDAVAGAFAATLDTHGRIDGCFANAGIGGRGQAFDEMPFDEWRRVMSVNLDGTYHTFRHAAGHMRERGEAGDPGGRLVATASLAAISGQARGEHYAATKGALVSMIKALAVEYARYGVTAHTISAGLDRNGDDRAGVRLRQIRRQRDEAHPGAPLGTTGRFRGDRRVHHERRERVSHRRYLPDRRRLLQFLARGEFR